MSCPCCVFQFLLASCLYLYLYFILRRWALSCPSCVFQFLFRDSLYLNLYLYMCRPSCIFQFLFGGCLYFCKYSYFNLFHLSCFNICDFMFLRILQHILPQLTKLQKWNKIFCFNFCSVFLTLDISFHNLFQQIVRASPCQFRNWQIACYSLCAIN